MQNLHQVQNLQFVSPRSKRFQAITEEQDNIEQDLQLLIRAHEKIRQLQQENMHLGLENQKLLNQLGQVKKKQQKMEKQKHGLLKFNEQLQNSIAKLQKQLQYKVPLEFKAKQNQFQQLGQCRDNQNLNQLTHNNQVNMLQNKNSQHKSQKYLKASQSTPVILNINVNTCSKQQRKHFLTSCKEQFTQQLQKIKQNESKTRKSLSRNKSECFDYGSLPTFQNKAQNRYGVNLFLKQAEKQFQDMNSKTIKNIGIDRKKCTSLIKKNNFAGIQFENKQPKLVFTDKTNLYNSKNASVNQILANPSKTHLGLNSTPKNSLTANSFKLNNTLKLNTFSSHNSSPSSIFQLESKQTGVKESFMKKNKKSIYFSQFSKSVFNSKEKDDGMKNRKKKSVDIQLQNQNNYGIIKYRGLCL